MQSLPLKAAPDNTASGTVGIAKKSSLVIGVDNLAMRTHGIGPNPVTDRKTGLTTPLDAKAVPGDRTVEKAYGLMP